MSLSRLALRKSPQPSPEGGQGGAQSTARGSEGSVTRAEELAPALIPSHLLLEVSAAQTPTPESHATGARMEPVGT